MSQLEIRLARPLRLAIAGEFNAGKSSLANLLAGIESLPTSIVSNTRIPTLQYFAASPEIYAVGADGVRTPIGGESSGPARYASRLEVGLPVERLKSMQLIDMPGIGDPRLGDEAAELALHGVDAVLWCTVATQAWKETERLAWSQLPARLRRRGILVVTHGDLISAPSDRARLLARLQNAAGPVFGDIVMLSTFAGAEPQVIALPAGEEETSRQAGDFERLQQAIHGLLDDVRHDRAASAIAATNRIAARALSRIQLA